MVDYIYVETFQILFWGLENSHASTFNKRMATERPWSIFSQETIE